MKTLFAWSHQGGGLLVHMEKTIDLPCFVPCGLIVCAAGLSSNRCNAEYIEFDIDEQLQTVFINEWKHDSLKELEDMIEIMKSRGWIEESREPV